MSKAATVCATVSAASTERAAMPEVDPYTREYDAVNGMLAIATNVLSSTLATIELLAIPSLISAVKSTFEFATRVAVIGTEV